MLCGPGSTSPGTGRVPILSAGTAGTGNLSPEPIPGKSGNCSGWAVWGKAASLSAVNLAMCSASVGALNVLGPKSSYSCLGCGPLPCLGIFLPLKEGVSNSCCSGAVRVLISLSFPILASAPPSVSILCF